MSSPFRSSYAQEVYDKKKASESDDQSEASDVTPIVIPKLKKIRKKVNVSLLSSEQRLKREQTKIIAAKDYASNKEMKNLSISK